LREKTSPLLKGEENQKKVPVIVNVCNFQKALNWKTTLYLRDVETIFHEFWHALHEILSESKYSELSGFWVEWDFVELPSQFMENRVSDEESLSKLAKHYETWNSIPNDLMEKLDKLKTFSSWIFWIRQNEFALLDMNLYKQKPPKTTKDLDKETLKIINKYSLFKRKDDYKMYCSFSHIFWWWYAAGYYSYMRAEILELDVFSKVKQMWMFEPKTGKKLLDTIIWQWTRKKASELFFDFMWRKVDDKAFLERYGL
jgi:Zn-dependent oligopeptidase